MRPLPVLVLALAACRPPASGRAPLVRQPVDNVGYTHTAAGIERVVAHARKHERIAGGAPLFGGISPHDDYLYAARVYAHLYPRLGARDVILIGVAHKARPETDGKLIFDGFDAWRGPYGPVPISPLRAELLRSLPRGDVVVHDRLQAQEHSVEALVPFLQHQRRDARIVSILVPYVRWPRLAQLARRTGAALAAAMKRRGLRPGADVAVLISADLVHYGDRGWGGKRHADFGVGRQGYDRAVARDRRLIEEHLLGPVDERRLEQLFHRLVQEDLRRYRITWCGRFSIPFGVAMLGHAARALGRGVPRGELLRYGTTLDPGRGDVKGLGVTAPASLRHWVSFAAIGYWAD